MSGERGVGGDMEVGGEYRRGYANEAGDERGRRGDGGRCGVRE